MPPGMAAARSGPCQHCLCSSHGHLPALVVRAAQYTLLGVMKGPGGDASWHGRAFQGRAAAPLLLLSDNVARCHDALHQVSLFVAVQASIVPHAPHCCHKLLLIHAENVLHRGTSVSESATCHGNLISYSMLLIGYAICSAAESSIASGNSARDCNCQMSLQELSGTVCSAALCCKLASAPAQPALRWRKLTGMMRKCTARTKACFIDAGVSIDSQRTSQPGRKVPLAPVTAWELLCTPMGGEGCR